ncbi:hypothetical protein EVA_01756 [gut metagenome]|uniref:Uncharacterized protein n=1 Tax=gut metagenome TaxID=749906 RepID=J9H2N3_9ZZZZ
MLHVQPVLVIYLLCHNILFLSLFICFFATRRFGSRADRPSKTHCRNSCLSQSTPALLPHKQPTRLVSRHR